MKKKTLTDVERNNKIAMMAHTITDTVMLIFCVLQVFSGLTSWSYVLGVGILGLGPVVAEHILWRKDKATSAIKHLVAIGFAVFYTVILFTSFNNMVYTFAIPMILVVSVFNDTRYSIMINTGTILESFIIVVLGARTGEFGFLGMDAGIIQIVVMILVGIYSIMTANTLDRNVRQRVQHVEEAQSRTETVLQDISRLSEQMKGGIEKIYEDLEKLNQASDVTKDSMKEVSAGALETAEAVQNQLLQTEAIQSKVDMVDNAADHITENMEKTLQVLKSGKQDMGNLVEQVDASVKNSEDVAEKLQTLDKYMEEMNSIVEIISEITSQTSLLALNASIEAARAGEAGKGFAVVATEITGMATRTNEATVHITELIQNVSSAIREVVNVIYQMIEGINEEKEGASHTAKSFADIESNTFAIRDNMQTLAESITDLQNANRVIVDSIQTISAISEEVSAHANMTMGAEEENAAVLEKISDKMQELITHVQQS